MEQEKIEILKTAYNAHKTELIYRRKLEFFTGFFTISLYIFFILSVSFIPVFERIFFYPANEIVSTIIVILMADIQSYFFMKNYKRQCELLRAICSIDHAFGFFLKNEYLDNETLYEESWQNAGRERSFGQWARLLIVMSFAGLLIAAIWTHGWS
jgi:hypothetical protein